MFNDRDKEILASRGITEKELLEQVKRFETGFPYLRIADSARVGAGIVSLDNAGEEAGCRPLENANLKDGGQDIEIRTGIGCGIPYVQSPVCLCRR